MEESGGWSTLYKSVVILAVQTNPVPKPHTIKILFCQVSNISTIWTKSSQYLISKCYKIVQKLWKTITKSYNIYAKYPEKYQKTFRDFLHNFVISFQVCILYMGIRYIFYTPAAAGGRTFRDFLKRLLNVF